MKIEKFIRPDLADFAAYSARKAPETVGKKVKIQPENIIKLDANENLYGPSPKVGKALGKYPYFNIYPDNNQLELRQPLAGYTGVDARHIVAANGSNQLIDLIVRLFVSPGDEVIDCVPTFGIYRFSTQLCNGKLVEVPRDKDFNVNVNAIKKAISKKTKLIFLANPNSPTGNLTPRKDILTILETGLPVVTDEAYYEFSGETVAPFVSKYENLMVLRTFSKWAGLAGMRVGYGLFPPRIADYLLKIKMPYNVSVAAIIAIRESFKDIAYLTENIKAIVAERDRLFKQLKKFDWLKPYPSRANFILCNILNNKANELCQQLESRGILVRFYDTPRLQNFIRISVGKPEHTDALVKALREIGKEL